MGVQLETNHATYWWRCRADDGDDTGPWSDVATFLVNEINNPPNVVDLEAPVNGGALWSFDDSLVWRTVADPDPGDVILDYHLEIDDDPDFGSPVVRVEGILVTGVPDGVGYLVGLTINDLTASNGLASGRWYWRIRARDSRFRYGDWSPVGIHFRMASDYEQHIHHVYSPEELLDDSVAGPNADPDGDGIGQMIEFACHMNPSENSREGAPIHQVVEVDGKRHLAIEFNRRIDTDLKFKLMTSSDLQQWTDLDATVVVMGAVDAGTERCQLVDPAIDSGTVRRFIRLVVSTP